MSAAAVATSSWKDCKQSNPPAQPKPPAKPSQQAQAARRLLFRVQDQLRPIQNQRVAACGRVRVSPKVAVRYSPERGKAHFGGLATCASVWACPVCSAIIRAKRADEVRRVIEMHGPERTYMLSLTVRHGLGDQLKTVRKGVADAFKRVIRGKPWTKFRKRFGISGYIRALEVTHGSKHGWHPHIHALLLTDANLTEEQTALATEWLATRWQKCVERSLGPEHRPNLSNGTDFSPCRVADYLSKLGLELTAPGRSKRAKNGNRTPMEIAYDFASELKRDDAELWHDYAESMFRARMLTWSRGLKKRFRKTDEELVEGEDAETFVAKLIEGKRWDRLRDVPGARAKLLDGVERSGRARLVLAEPKRTAIGPNPQLTPRRPRLKLSHSHNRRPRRHDPGDLARSIDELRHHLTLDLGLSAPGGRTSHEQAPTG